jgi:hypothetical protein
MAISNATNTLIQSQERVLGFFWEAKTNRSNLFIYNTLRAHIRYQNVCIVYVNSTTIYISILSKLQILPLDNNHIITLDGLKCA